MATKKKTYTFPGVIEVEEYHDGRYGAPGMKRDKKKKATPDQMAKVNQYNKEKLARRRLRQYFTDRDWFVTLTYKREARPPDIDTVKKHFKDFYTKLRKIYRKNEAEFFWIRNIENTTRGNWHIHVVINDLPNENLLRILNETWPHGTVEPKPLYKRGGFKDLAAYITKDEKSTRKDLGDIMDHIVTEANYSTSRNMPLCHSAN